MICTPCANKQHDHCEDIINPDTGLVRFRDYRGCTCESGPVHGALREEREARLKAPKETKELEPKAKKERKPRTPRKDRVPKEPKK